MKFQPLALHKFLDASCSSVFVHALHRAELPETGASIIFICIHVDNTTVRLRKITPQTDFLSNHIPSSCPKIHIFEMSIEYSGMIAAPCLKHMTFFANLIRSNGHAQESEIILMTTGWDDATQSLEKKEILEIELRRELPEYSHILERLEGGSIEHFREFVQRVVGHLDRPVNKSNSAGRYGIDRVKQDAEHWRVKWIQRDINNLYAELDKTPAGRGMRRKLERASADQSKYLKPILAQMDDEDLDKEERKKLEEKMEEEYALSRKEFQRHFEIIREMEIAIGPRLREFYHLPPPIEPKKKRFVLF
ncbi:hypothetical protein NP233_g8254 [Leucocoprinus birnbaumii]|uniref:Uncharacterized protein n=1 Tax=Leucocoprinus birnbaumii TaxID=56174 RepID=A0AAD5VR81_9AGAR|nr:hypothetical protein NP233_g8254 [Leucocoprinus birnbaumii]